MGFNLFKSIGDVASGVGGTVHSFANNVSTVAGHAVGVLPKNEKVTGVDWRGIDNVTNSIGDAVKKVPVVGPLFHGLLGVATQPFSISENILKGERIDHVAVDALKQRIGDIREIAPYAQTVIALVPGVGPVASSAIGAGLALAQGLPADEVLAATIAGALPGGAIALAAYKVGRTALVQHKLGNVASLVTSIGSAAGIPIPPAANAALTGGLNALTSMVNGQKPDAALLQAALRAAPDLARGIDLSTALGQQNIADALVARGQSLIPSLSQSQRDAIKNALHIGLAFQHAQNLQALVKKSVGTGAPLQHLLQVGQSVNDAVTQAARDSLQGRGVTGFNVATGLTAHRTTPLVVNETRKPLPPEDKHGFDVAAALRVGRVTRPAPPGAPAAVQAGHAITHGARTASPDRRVAIARTVASTPGTAAGGKLASIEISKANREWLIDGGLVSVGLVIGAVSGGLTWAAVGAITGGVAAVIHRNVT
ncbi:MAG: hypothetical protein ACHREM_21025 [Polyangiales bacterium]